MHWLPLVAMVIASALPLPHNPMSRIAAATTEPGFNDHREERHDSAAVHLATPSVDNDLRGKASQTDFYMNDSQSRHAQRQKHGNSKDYVKSSIFEETATSSVEHKSQSSSGSGGKSSAGVDGVLEGQTLRTGNISQDNSAKDYRADVRSRQDYSSFMDLHKKDNHQDSTDRPLQVSAAENKQALLPALTLKSPQGPEPTAPSEQPKDSIRTGTERTPGADEGLAKESQTKAEIGHGNRLDSLLEGDEAFLDAHPRVLFSPSMSPPEHPPMLLMLENGMLDDDGGGEEQVDMDGHIEGHGDRALERGMTPSWTDSSGATTSDAARPVKRDKRSHLLDRRRGEKSVCESESVWVTDKKMAIDSHNRKVTVLQEIQTQTGPLKQFFYETRCRQPEPNTGRSPSRSAGMGVAGAGCFGVDKKQWLSECKAKQSYVRALTKDENNRTGWRWIRIDSSCVCVLLSRTNQVPGREVISRSGRG